MNRILLTFKVSKLERQFCKDRADHGNDFLRGYLVFLLAETIALSVIYSQQVNNSSLGLLVSAGGELLLGLILRGIGILFFKEHFNILVAIQNIMQALLCSIVISALRTDSDTSTSCPSAEQLAWYLGLLVKHIYLLLGSAFVIKIATAAAIWATYFAQTISMESGFHRDYSAYFLAVLLMGFILNGFRIYREDLALRNMFLVQRSEEEMNFLVKKLLPVSMLITRYDKKEERVYFHMSNAKVQKNLNIVDNDTMKNFFMRVQLFSIIEEDSTSIGSLFQYLHLQAKQQAFKHFKRKASKMIIPHINNNTNNPNLGANYIDQMSVFQEKQQQQNHFLNSMNNGFQSEDFLGPNNFISPRQLPDEPFSQRQSSIVAPDLQESMNNAFARASTMRKRKQAHKKTIIQQFDNLTQKNDTNYNNTAGNLNGNNNNHNGGSSEGVHQPQQQQLTSQVPYDTFTRQQTIKQPMNHINTSNNYIPQTSSLKQKDISDEVFDQLDVFRGVLQGDSKKIFNIKIYTYALEEIYQVIIFEDETLQGKVEFLTKLNKYCFGLFEQMLKKLRVPLASSLYNLKRAAANIRHSNFQSMRSRQSSRSNVIENYGLHLLSTDTSQANNNNINHLPQSNQLAMNLPNIEMFSQQSQQNYWQQQLQQTFHAVSENNNNIVTANSIAQGGVDQQQIPLSSNAILYGDPFMLGQGSMISKQLSSNQTYGMEPIRQQAKSLQQQQQYITEASDVPKRIVSIQENQALEEYVGIRENLAKKIEEMQFCNYGILNNLFNFSDVFHCFTKNTSLPFTAMNLSLERVIADLKSIFTSEYRNRQLEIFFFNELTQAESFINTNEKYLKQLLINLLTNSLSALSIEGKGYTAVHFKLDPTNKEVIDIYVMDSGPGFDEEKQKEKRLILQNLNAITLEKNMKQKDLQIGLALSEKIVGRLGPYEHIKSDRNIIKVQIFRDYQNLFKKQDQVIQRNKSIFVKNRNALTEGNLEEDLDDDDSNYERNIIHSAVLKQQIIDRNEIVLSAKHTDYFQSSA